MSTIQFIGTTPNDLINQIKDEIIPSLRNELSAEFQPKEPTKYLSIAEVCEMLQIDRGTLANWRKKKILTAYGIENRVFFKRSEIDDYITQNKLN
ncbi:MAG: helix-turn-helix domain-containing protein [Flavobacteriales bacterium]|nr:helix-turn-helix domain-containing protein [Flavobacteriales bacterium]